MTNLFANIYRDKRVFVTGHTGFKGSWLCYWLDKMGAQVLGYSLGAPTNPNHFSQLNLPITEVIGDIRNQKLLLKSLYEFQPEIIFHLAAQPLVRLSYEEPVETFETNIMGTVNLLSACRSIASVKAIINVTSDKCYQNNEQDTSFKETDPMGGLDPYSASKGCSELVTASFRDSYFPISKFQETHEVLVASCRAGNVIGGGDWARDRLIADIMIAVSENCPVTIRNPHATRPWQHVLEALSGYLLLGQKLLEAKQPEFATGWNFGPTKIDALTVKEIVLATQKYWPAIEYQFLGESDAVPEAGKLQLDCSKARKDLQWNAVWDAATTVEKTVNWYRNYYENGVIDTEKDFASYLLDAKKSKAVWVK
jgi:CDP-glucose 4,6-dehydratase